MITTRSLRRTYQSAGRRRRDGTEIVALDDFSLDIGTGEVHGLLARTAPARPPW
jgi:ABC-type multidrug transport system ATPase subunit